MKVLSNNISKRKLKTAGTPLDYSLKLLSIRSYSEKSMLEKLIKKKFSTCEISRTVKKLREYGYINDETFAERLIESGKKKLIGRIKLSYDIYKKGINKQLADELIDKFYTKDEEKDIAVKALNKKTVSLIKYKENDLIFKKKLYDFLQRRGFSSNVIENILNISSAD
ncbi:MAG: regulatory protein RecX [Candidatus Acidulodesulfobacterium ferriphilum]|uniref:Regulatory protein RecX n=1 Tax=Candidatus Acidulodesulfobacterium ferriphilum TaxID=2597223 RepID=A0A519BC64_9DELT|nr:MAG: regulatory protein RecX [Candidatus Acidulodesulfobacterium ferriphilum]